MSDNSSFDSEALSDDSKEDEETKSQTEKEKQEGCNNSPENVLIKNKKLIKAISNTLYTILEKNKRLKNYKEVIKKQSKMYFSAYTIPNISLNEYLIRIQSYSDIEKSTLILALILIDKMCKKSEILLTPYNIHRILFSSVLISIKYNEDNYFDNTFYSQIAGVKTDELQMLEYTFLEYNNFNVFVYDYEFERYENYLGLD